MHNAQSSSLRQEKCHAVLRKRSRLHPLRGGWLRLPAVAHPRRGVELDDILLHGQRTLQRDRGAQGRVPLHHDGPAQCQRRQVLRSARDRAALGRPRRRSARPDGSLEDRQVSGDGLLHRRPLHLEPVATGARSHRCRGAGAAQRLPPGSARPFLPEQHQGLGPGTVRPPARHHHDHGRCVPEQDVPRQRRLRLHRDARFRARLPHIRTGPAGRRPGSPVCRGHGVGAACAERPGEPLPLERTQGPHSPGGAPHPHLPPGAPPGGSWLRRRERAPHQSPRHVQQQRNILRPR